jgi:hypothetical protein
MDTVLRCCLILVISIAALAGCGTSTPQPTVTMVPTLPPPTSTPVPPTATSLPTNTSTPAPTNTPAPTATPRPTNTPVPTATPLPTNTLKPAPTKAVTPKPTNTKAPAAPVASGGGVSSKPSTLGTSIEQSFNTAQGIIGLLDQMTNGGGVELCAPLIANYQSIHNAPAYDMSGQSNEMQQAYATYRRGIDILETQAAKILGCGQNGGPLGGLDIGLVHHAVTKSVDSFGQARDWTSRAVSISPASSLPDAVQRVQLAVSQIDLAYQHAGSGQREECDPFIHEYNVLVNAPVYDVSAEPSNVQNAYALYRQGIDLTLSRASSVVEMCNRGGGTLGTLDYSQSLRTMKTALAALNQALDALGLQR